MSPHSWINKLFGLVRRSPIINAPGAGKHVRRGRQLRLEWLEDRVVPSTYTWKPVNLTGNWNDSANWTSPDGITFPAAGDIAIFSGAPTGAVTVSLNGSQSAATVTFNNTAQSYTIAASGTSPSLTVGTSLTSAAGTVTAPLTNVISAPLIINNATLTETTGNLTLSGQVSASNLTGTVSAGTLKFTNFSAATANSITGTFTVNGGILEAFTTQTAGTDSIGTANVVLNGGTLKLDPVPSVFATTPSNTVGVVGRYFNLGFTGTNSTTGTAQADFSGTPAATRNEGAINFAIASPPAWQPAGVNANNFGVDWVGGLNILTGGSYTFTFLTDDSATLLIDGVSVINNLLNTTGTGTVTLAAGFHSLEARFVQLTGGGGAVLSYAGPDPGATAVVVPVAADATKSGLFQYSTAAATFTNNVTVNAGATGTIDVSNAAMDPTLGTLTTNAGSTLNVTGSFTGRVVNFSNVTLKGNTTFNPTGGNLTPGAISESGGSFGATKVGVGNLILTQPNTFTGTANIAGGTVTLTTPGTVGAAPLNWTSGTVVLTSPGVLGASGTVNLTAGETLVAAVDNALNGLTINVAAGAVLQALTANALAGATVNLSGGLSLRADAATTFNVGTLNFNSNAAAINVNRLVTNAGAQTLTLAPTTLTFGTGVTTINVTGGNGNTLQLNSAVTLPSNLTVNTLDANLSINGAISGAFKIIKTGVNTLNFLVDSPGWTGSSGATLDIAQGSANINTANAAGANVSIVTLKGGTLALNGTGATTYALGVALDPVLSVGTIQNVANVANNISGTLTMTAGQQLQTTGQNTITFTTAALTTAAGNYLFNTNGSNLQFNGVLSGAGTVVKLGAQQLALGAVGGTTANTYSGGTVLNAGVLQANGVTGGTLNNFGTGTITVNGGTLNVFAESGQNNVYTNSLVFTANATIGFGRVNSNVTNTIIYLTGTLTLANNTVTFNSNNGYRLAAGGATTLLGNATMNGNGQVIFSGAVGDGGNGYGITYTGSNQVLLNAVNTYTGATRVNAGTLAITAAGKIASGNVFVEPGAFLTLPSATGWFSGGTQPNLFVNSSPTVLAVVQINYTGALPTLTSSAPAGGATAGVLALGSTVNINIAALGSNPAIVLTPFTGQVTQAINLGAVGDGSFFLGAASNITYNGTLTPSGTTYRLGAAGAQLALGTSAVLADNGGATGLVVGTSLANGTGNLTNGTGTVVLLNSNTYTGGTTVNRGSTLVVGTTATATASPLGTGAATVYGTLTAAGINGSFLASGSTTSNTNAITLNPGSVLNFDNTNGFQGLGAGNNTNRWGDTTGIALNGSTLQLLGQNNAAGSAETVGTINFDKGSTVIIKRNTGTSNNTILTAAGLTRVGQGTLALITSANASLGAATNGDQFIVTNHGVTAETTRGVASDGVTVNMVPPYTLDVTNGAATTFVDYDPASTTGFKDVVYTVSDTASTWNATTVHDIVDVNLAATATVPANASVYAIRLASVAGGLSGASAGIAITIDSGGMLLGTTGVLTNATPALNFRFGPSPGGTFAPGEAIIAVVNGKTPAVPGTITANGLTFVAGGNGTNNGTVTLTANNTASLTGTITVNSGGTPLSTGALIVQNTVLRGNVVVNAGTLTLQSPNGTATAALSAASTVTLNGGTLSVLIDGTGSNQTIAAYANNNVTVNFDATINVSRPSANTGNTVQFGSLTIGNSTLTKSSANTYTPAFATTTLTANATFSVSSETLLLGVVSDGGNGFGITKTGAAILALSATNRVPSL